MKDDFKQALVRKVATTVFSVRAVTIGYIERSSQKSLLHNTIESSNGTQCVKKKSVRMGKGN
jgi:hypothetical protein